MRSLETFVIALPDSDTALPLARRVSGTTTLSIDHASGRPWIRARLGADRLLVSASERTRVAIVGPTSATESDLHALVSKRHTPREIVERTRVFDGNFELYASIDGELVAAGPVSQSRRIFHAKLDGALVLANRADALADLGDLPMNPVAIGMHLLPNLPHPLNDRAMWDGVEGIPGGDYIAVGRSGTDTRTRTWWRRPKPTLSRAEGAAHLRAALEAAVRARSAPGSRIAADLSGGLDSTPVCYFAAQGADGVIARTFFTDDPGGREDLKWAERALVAMPGVREHEVFSVDSLPDFYGGLEDLSINLDEPSQTYMAAPRLLEMMKRDVPAGVSVHLTGIGGDHLFRRVAAWDHTLARSRPLTAWRRARDDARSKRVPALATLRQLIENTSYEAWLDTALQQATRRSHTIELPGLGDWGPPLAFPEWVTDDAVAALVDEMRKMVGGEDGLDGSIAEHFDVYTVREAGRVARGMSYLGQPVGVLIDSPLLDDHVLDAVLAVRYDERDRPLEWKPLIKEAMRGLLPDDYLHRATKIGGGPQAVRGYAKNYDALTAIWEESGIFDHEFIDRRALTAASRPSDTQIPSPMVITLTNVAMFLRDVQLRRAQPIVEETR